MFGLDNYILRQQELQVYWAGKNSEWTAYLNNLFWDEDKEIMVAWL